ncbi:MAG: hypothetical protein HC851_14315 [Acaryochloris sp. RU_4_1]|nr:hypothetical protein [Acaryochloris sp. RU_4_1]NJR56010.1 hypothetical protein [Acaryochloris sp. CRU_2_0]
MPVDKFLSERTNSNNKIVIIDDDKDLAETASWAVEEAGYEPVLIVEGFFKAIDDLVSEIPEDVYGVLCDHRLGKSSPASFYGSDLVAALYDRKIPALLETQFYDMDSDVSIRRYRHKIPVLLDRDNVDASTIESGMQTCLLELNGTVSSDRKPYRNIVRLVDISQESGEEVIDAIIPGWNPHKAVRLPSSLIHEWILDFQPMIGTRLIANVNSGAENPEDLYFTDFEIAPELEEIDGIS